MRHLLCFVTLCLLLSGCSTAAREAARSQEASRLQVEDSWETNHKIIKAAEASGAIDVALATAGKDIEARPENAEARKLLARLLTRTDAPAKALIVLQPLLASPDHETLVEKGRALMAMGEAEEAYAVLQDVLAKTPEKGVRRDAQKLSAICLDLTAKHREAQELYRAVLAEQEEVGARYNLGRSLIADKQFKAAATVLMPLVDLPGLPQARLAAAGALAKSDDMDRARDLLAGHIPAEQIETVLGGL